MAVLRGDQPKKLAQECDGSSWQPSFDYALEVCNPSSLLENWNFKLFIRSGQMCRVAARPSRSSLSGGPKTAQPAKVRHCRASILALILAEISVVGTEVLLAANSSRQHVFLTPQWQMTGVAK